MSVESADQGPANLSGFAYRAISDMIRRHELKSGDPIVEAKLADALAISRTPIREALQRLEGEGLIVKAAGRSFMVRRVTLTEYLQSLKVREILEAEAAAAAIGRIPEAAFEEVRRDIEASTSGAYSRDAHWNTDAKLHNLFIDACGNEIMASMIRALRATTHLFEIARLQDRLKPDNTEHLAIIDAIRSGDPKAARRATQQHIRSLYRFALEVIS
ncbi:GntR family transcriptional regulator [Prosthecomicrobium sp. N25]|uniref:GntR family transcriptional regulator n=1 Tax=Prosthecomicrobium sp. N25 TaxID=3129254 RepID=UPI0030775551